MSNLRRVQPASSNRFPPRVGRRGASYRFTGRKRQLCVVRDSPRLLEPGRGTWSAWGRAFEARSRRIADCAADHTTEDGILFVARCVLIHRRTPGFGPAAPFLALKAWIDFLAHPPGDRWPRVNADELAGNPRNHGGLTAEALRSQSGSFVEILGNRDVFSRAGEAIAETVWITV